MDHPQSRSIPSRALHLMLTTCLMLTSPSSSTHAFQSLHHPASSSSSSPYITSSSSSLQARKGNRIGKKPVSENTSKRTRPQVNDVLDGINSPPEFPHSVDPSVDLGPVSDDPLADLVRTIVRAADMRKASDIVALRVTSCTSLTEFVVLASGTSRPQNQAIASAIANDVEDEYGGKRCLGKGVPEGTADSGWILLDYGEVMVHVMTPKSRLFYDMEGEGGGGDDLGDVLMLEDGTFGAGSAMKDEAGGEDDGLSMKERLDVEKEADPFWS
eukprot:CAMPEP_0181108052 /NCGR_PEP_ID=MMETSP1071-20121207/17419_1 /TAXON_ID=35127 /ORGANISM="Thalassiosira sp., Strain NH16" /LENGTH=270 /DNA_ID=CAMNT_0023191619 /DNA_START=54 /DNA_END=867 /DNA_ORIENTATION=+